MRQAIYGALKPVRARQQVLFALRCAAVGLGAAAVVGLALGAARLVFGWELPAILRIGVLVAGPIVGLLVGLILQRRWHDAGSAVDGHYGLKDRAVTALAFADQAAPTELQALQMADAVDHLNRVEAKAVVPLRAPRSLAFTLTAAAAAAVLLAWPLARPQAEASPAPVPDHILSATAEQKEKLAALEKKLAETTQDFDDEKSDDEKKGLKELLQKLAQKLEELAEPGTDEKEALAKLSEMQADMQAMANQLNVAALEGQLASLGTALAASTAFEGAGKALQDGKLEKAAKELEKLDEVQLTPKEAKALEEKLKQLAKQMGDAGQGALSDSVSELADGIHGGGKGKVGKTTRSIAKKVNNAVKRRKINDLLRNELDEVQECKCNCNGGARVRVTKKSESPSSNWGRGVAGNVDGDKTKLNSRRNVMQITGQPAGEGDSDAETTATPEARQQASREYKEKYQKFKKESEAVLEGEPIPLGHRQMVKKYFELIRPSGNGSSEKEAAKPEK
jgi:hypothetical protein